MDLQTIANLLLSAIRSRQNLTIGEATGTIIAGGTGSFTTAFGLITATATNFCTGKCCLAKVEGKWYAIGNEQQSVVIRSSVDRLIQSRRKPVATELFLGKFIGTNENEDSPRKIIYDFDIDLDLLFAEFVPPVNPNAIAFYLDNISGEDESDLAGLYWRVSCYNSNIYGAERFFSIDSAGAVIDYQIPFVQSPQIGGAIYIGNSRYLSVYGQNFTQPITFGNPTLLRFYSPTGIENGTIVGINLLLEQPSATLLGIYSSPVPAQTTPQPRAVNGNYYRDSNFRGDVRYTNNPAGLITGETYDGNPVTGIVTVNYGALGIETNSKIPVAIGHKTLSRVFSNPILKAKAVIDARYANWSPTLLNGTLIRARAYSSARSNAATYDLDGLSVDLYDLDFGSDILESDRYNLIGIDTVGFAPAFQVFFGGFATQKVAEQTTEFNIGVGSTVLSKSYAPAEFYARFKSAKVAIVTDRIRNCQFTDLTLNKLTAASLSPEFERYEATGATYTTSSDAANPTDFRGLIFKSVEFFDPKVTNILNSQDCYAKFYRVIGRNNKLYGLEFWVLDDGRIDLVGIHERESLAGEPDPRFRFQSRLYYPPSESES